MTNKNNVEKNEHLAKASSQNLSVSTKHCIEICNHLRYKTTAQAKKILEDVIDMKVPIPFKRFKRSMGHKPGMAAGRFPQKAAKVVLDLVKSVEANAQNKGLNTSSLKIIKMLANKASTPMTGGRQRTGTKRSHVEIEVKETKQKKKETKKKTAETPKEKAETKQEEPAKETAVEETKKEPATEELQKENTQKTATEKEDIKKEPVKPEEKVEPTTETGEQAK